MEEEKEEEKAPKKISNKFNAYCKKCNNIIEFNLDKKLLTELKEYVEEGKEKYKNEYAISRNIVNGCPLCHKDIEIKAKSYVDFFENLNKDKQKNN